MENLEDPDSDTVCSICYAEFLDTEDLNRHITQYHLTANKNRFCKFCLRTFSDLDALALHIRDHHLRDLLSCRYCTRLYLDGDALSQHTKKHKSSLNPEIQCSQCDLTFNDSNDLEKHEYDEHSECGDGVMLQHCYAALSLVLNMNIRNFFKACHGNLSFHCKACKFSSLDMTKFLHHKATEKCRTFCCDICYNVYCRKYELKNHCLKHMWMLNPNPQDQKLQCKLCNMLCTSTDEMKTHLSTHSLTNIMQIQICKYCRRPFVGVDALLKHIERSHKHDIHLYKYNCIYCNITFKHPKFLFGHFYTRHTNIHPYTCKLCNKTFRIRKKFSLHIKLEHESIGSVEFDDHFHVYFTEKSPGKESVSENTKHNKVSENFLNESVNNENENNNILTDYVDVNEDSVTSQTEEAKLESDTNKADSDHNLLVERKGYKRTKTLKRQLNRKEEISEVSSDSDVPLAKIIKVKKKRTTKSKKKKIKFLCPKCKVNCYTFQNFNRHLSLHNKKEGKMCIKCKQEFKSVDKLNAHIKAKHSTSQLTETLKKIHEQKKKNNEKMYVSEQFMTTMMKVPAKPSETQATITPVDTDKMSVKKYLESFTPDTDKISVTSNVTIKQVQTEQRAPVIKMRKFTPERPRMNPQKLRMPERFRAEPYVRQKVSIKIVHPVSDPQLNLKDEVILSDFHSADENDMDQDRGVPEVGHEVMLEETQPDNVKYYKNTIVIDNVPDHNEIVIAHLAPEAPFYKIVKIQDVLQDKPIVEEEAPKPPTDLTLPNGMKLVNVNPLAHLLDKDVFKRKPKPNMRKKDFSRAIINAMARLKTPRRIKKERKDC